MSSELSRRILARTTTTVGTSLLLLLALTSAAFAARLERDQNGRTVAVPDHPHRVVSLSPNLTNTVYALGAESDLIGITDFTFYPAQAAKQKPSVGAIVNPSLERIVALHPDLVIGVAAFNGAETIAGLQRLGIPVFLFNIGGLADIYQTVADVGRVLDREDAAKKLAARLHAREDTVRTEAHDQRPSVLLVYSIDPFITAGNKAFVTEMIRLAGARSVTEDLPQDWLQMNVEAVLPRNPDYILLMKDEAATIKQMQHRAGWSSLEAVRRGRILTLEDCIQVPGPIAFDGLEDLARQIRAAQSQRALSGKTITQSRDVREAR